MEPGKWVLAAGEGYYYPGEKIHDWLQLFRSWGGGWDGHPAESIFRVQQVERVMPKTYLALERRRGDLVQVRAYRSAVIAVFEAEEAAVRFRDEFHAIGVQTTSRVEAEAARRITAFANREKDKALNKIHKALPHLFGVRS